MVKCCFSFSSLLLTEEDLQSFFIWKKALLSVRAENSFHCQLFCCLFSQLIDLPFSL